MIKSYNFEIHFKNDTIGIVENIINPAVTFLNIKNKVLETIDKINLISIVKDTEGNILNKSIKSRIF